MNDWWTSLSTLNQVLYGIATFKLLSVRSVIAFGMLFGWAGALYL